MSFRTLFLTFTIALVSSCMLPLQATYAVVIDDKKTEEKSPEKDYFFPSENVMEDVDATLASAKSSNKLALIVLGADWCHDSQGLVSRFDDPAMKALLDESYETAIIDVAFFDHGIDVVRRFGQPMIFATPTVMIIDPASEQLVNGHNMHQFKDADAMGLEKTIAYFDSMRSSDNHSQAITAGGNATLEKLLSDITAFEAKQAHRIENGFQQMVPYLKMTREERPQKFRDIWGELRGLRYTITGDMAALRKQARDRSEAGEKNITLTYPTYKSFSWE